MRMKHLNKNKNEYGMQVHTANKYIIPITLPIYWIKLVILTSPFYIDEAYQEHHQQPIW